MTLDALNTLNAKGGSFHAITSPRVAYAIHEHVQPALKLRHGSELGACPPARPCFRDGALHLWLVSPSFTLSSLFLPFSAMASEHGSSPPTQRQIHTEFPLQSSRMSLMTVLICSTQFHANPLTWDMLSSEGLAS